MCGRFISVQKIEVIEKRFNLKPTGDIGYKPSYNIAPGKKALVVTNDAPKKLQMFMFGMIPFWAKKKMLLINARSEGDNNKENNPKYLGGKGIISKPAFRKPIRSQRCLVIADGFYEGPEKEKLSKPYMVYLKNNVRPFAFAGIWDTWEDQDGQEIKSFSIITTVANKVLQAVGHHRSPVILKPGKESKWLNNDLPLADVTAMLQPYDSSLMNAYPVGTDVKNPRNDGKELVEPIGQRIFPEKEIIIKNEAEEIGFGRKLYRDDDNRPTITKKPDKD